MTAIATAADEDEVRECLRRQLGARITARGLALDRVFERDSAHRPLVPFMPLFSLSRRNRPMSLPNRNVFRTAASGIPQPGYPTPSSPERVNTGAGGQGRPRFSSATERFCGSGRELRICRGRELPRSGVSSNPLPSEEPRSSAPSSQETSLQETSLQDTSVQETSLQETASQETSLQDTSVQETASQETSLQETSVQLTPRRTRGRCRWPHPSSRTGSVPRSGWPLRANSADLRAVDLTDAARHVLGPRHSTRATHDVALDLIRREPGVRARICAAMPEITGAANDVPESST